MSRSGASVASVAFSFVKASVSEAAASTVMLPLAAAIADDPDDESDPVVVDESELQAPTKTVAARTSGMIAERIFTIWHRNLVFAVIFDQTLTPALRLGP